MRKSAFSRDITASVLALTAAGIAQASPAWAQNEPAAAMAGAPAGVSDKEIIVTGSRLGRTSYNSPTPVNVVGQRRVQDLNITSVGDALNQIPAFRPITTPATNSFRSSANIAGRNLDLRGLGAIRTLTLVDGRRHVATGDDGNFDLNTIPSIMVQRSEVVTGGASAAYGAGAVSGVVNLILDTHLNGMKSEISYGISDQNDARNLYGAFAGGADFAGGRGHVVIGAEYADEDGIGDATSRDWSRKFVDYIPNPFFSTNPALSNGLPATIITPNVTTVLNPGGVISIVHPLQGMQFDANGNLIPFQFGALFNKAKPSGQMVGGDPTLVTNFVGGGSPLAVGTEHFSAVTHAEFDVTDSIVASGEISYAKVDGGPTSGAIRTDQNGAIRINRDNAFLTPSTAAAMDAAHTTFIPLNRINYELGPNIYTSSNEVWEGYFGLKGALAGDWKWDAFYQYGQTKGTQYNSNSRLEQRWKDAIDAVFAPAGIPGIAPGTIICRTTITNPTNGCIPANVMGAGKVSPAAAAWVNSIAYSTRLYTQQQVAANVRGTLFEGWAGPISGAAGVEYRADSSKGDNDPNSKLGLYSQLSWTFLPSSTQKVTEGYGEVNVPLLRDSPLGKSLEFDGALRQTHYSLSGDATTWKGGLVYRLNDDYMLRVTRSRDIRAPTSEELNPNRRTLVQPLTDPKYAVSYNMPNFNGGNPNLELETANTFTAGVVLQPHFVPKFRVSIDYYDIKVENAIDILGSTAAIALCRQGNTTVCKLGTDNAGNPDRILELYATYQNVNELHASGLEFVSNYSLDLADIAHAMSGTLDFTLNGNYIDTLSTTFPDGSTKEFSDVLGNAGAITNILGVPKWRADFLITYLQPRYSVTGHVSYIPEGILNRDWVGPEDPGYSPYLANSVTFNHISSRTYLDLTARTKLFGGENSKLELFGGVTNVFDTDPPSELRFVGNPLYYNPIGRSYKIGLRANW